MKIPRIAIENYQFTLVVIILLVLSGIVSFINMPRSEDPQVSKPGSSVIVLYPGTTPADLEQLIISPIEEALNELDDIKKIESKCEDGLALIFVEFYHGTDPDEQYSDVNEKINSIMNNLPDDILSLQTKKWTVEDTNFLQLAIVSENSDYRELEKRADNLKKRVEKVTGVRRVETCAFPEQELRISMDMEKIARMNIPLKQIIGAIQVTNMNIPGGNIDAGIKRFNIKTSGSYDSIEEIKNTIVHSIGTRVVYLKDIADVFLGYKDDNYFARFNGKRAVFVTANQKRDTNIFDIIKGVKEKVSEFEEKLPKSVKLYYVYDQSESVHKRLSNFFSNLIQGIILVGIVILIALGLRGSLIVMLAIPFSILIAIGFVDMSGFGLEQMSIAGLVITLGLLVDNAIVVTENISRFIEKGESNLNAAIKGTNQIGWAIVSATATTVLAFVPIIMMQDITGDFIRSMPVTVMYTLIASLFIALTFTPFLSSKILKPKNNHKENKVRSMLKGFIENHYRKWLNFSISKPKIIITLAIIVFLGSLALFPFIGVSFFPKAEKNQFFIDISTPEGTNIDETDEAAKFVESVLSSRKEVKHYTTNIGQTNPQIYYNIMDKHGKSTIAHIFVQLKEVEREKMQSIINNLRNIFKSHAGSKIEVKELEQGPPIEAPIEIKILGRNINILKMIASDVEKIYNETPGLINIYNPLSTSKTDIQVNINRDKAGMLGIPLVDIDRTIRMNVAGLCISKYRDKEGKEYDIVVRSSFDKKPELGIFDRIYFTSMSGAYIPLKQVASVELKSSSTQINHFNFERSVTLTADVLRSYSINKATKTIISRLNEYTWPDGYNYYIGGERESQETSFGGMSKAIIIAIIAIFGVLVLQFKSFSQPIIVFAALPFAIIGSIIALLITGNSFSFTAFIGLTSLVGIVVNNSIILVDYTNKLRKEGKSVVIALKEAGETRFMPIILTTFTTIGGLLPLTLGGGTLWAPMGWTIIGGLLTSTLLTLIVVPVLYKLLTKVK